MRRHAPKLLALLALGAALVLLRPLAAKALPALEALRSTGPQGLVLFCLGYGVATLLLLPTTPFTLLAGALYGPWRGLALLVLLSLAVDGLAFFLARAARQPLSRVLARFPRLARLDEALGEGGFGAVCLLRLSPLAPYAALTYALGLTRVRPAAFLAGTAVGSLPATLLFLFLGHGAAGMAEGSGSPLWPWVAFTLTAVSALGLTVWARRQLAVPASQPEVG
ncbi:TVP38/TMEM64 family protein [Hyalangium sp.]|uniref:TVP38/TMEM64 family protein n=1 Tax=Hyalangium sp. TaxID=2028555 RepID=UPI002D763332|nr:VTT domain-containing protein [Hyalangium sp.]HYH97994.1 VTT domain-containing protein [Hyalangium sp.]